jgi:DNA invertase Pin-like site-specific DNA recombinase
LVNNVLLGVFTRIVAIPLGFISKKELMDTSTPAGEFMLTMFGAMAQLERSYILDRQKEGIAIAKDEGKYKGRKPIEVDNTIWDSLYKQWKAGEITATKFMKSLDLKPNTFYRKLKDYEKGVGNNG